MDVDATRGRLYFPVTNGGIALEGQPRHRSRDRQRQRASLQSGAIHWVDEPRYNDPSNQVAANDTTPGAIEASATDGYQVPINTIKNEGGVTAFLDPLAYNNTDQQQPRHAPQRLAVLEQHPQRHVGHLLRDDQPALQPGHPGQRRTVVGKALTPASAPSSRLGEGDNKRLCVCQRPWQDVGLRSDSSPCPSG